MKLAKLMDCKNKKSPILTLLILLSFQGCQLEPPYEMPCVPIASQWKNEPKEHQENPSVCLWWEVFQDPELNRLEEMAVANNQNLFAALERVEEARDIAYIRRAALFPQLNLTPSYTNQEELIKVFGNNSTVIKKKTNNIFRAHELQYSLPFTLTYEVDLWGKIRDQYKSAYLDAESQLEAFRTTLLILTTDLATAYFQLRTQDALIDLFSSTIATRRKALEINKSLFEGMTTNYSAVALSQLDLCNVETQYYDAKRLRNLFEDQIAVLIGESASEFTIPHMPLNAEPPVISPGIPADILLRRPDLAEQERHMASIHALIGVAYASYFPQIDLTSSAGALSPISKDFLSGMSRYWMIGANITQFIFDAGARYYNVKYSWAEFREAVATYRQYVLMAFQDVEDALSNLEWAAKEMVTTKCSVEAAKTAYKIAYDRFLFGVGNYLDVADDERQELDNERAYISLIGNRFLYTIQLIKALGGGWNN